MSKIIPNFFSTLSKRAKNTRIAVLFSISLMLLTFEGKAQNNCLSFDGTDDYVNLGTLSPAGNFSTGFTFMGWVKWDAFNFYAPVIIISSGANDYSNANEISISGYASASGISFRCSNVNLTIQGYTALNQWVHIAATVSESGRMIAYVNGVEVSSYNGSPISNIVHSNCTLGSADYYSKFKGSIDEISVWSRALTVTEIQSKMNSSLAGNESGLYLYYRFNQGAPNGSNALFTTLTDASVNAKNGTLNNFALAGTTSNWISSTNPVTVDNNALAFDGTNDFVNLGTISPTGNFSTGFSYMGWVKWGAFNSWSRLFDFGTGAGYNNIMLANSSTSAALTLSNYLNTVPYQLTTGNILALNQWVHIAATISNTGAAKIYVNGVVAASGNVSAPVNIARTLNYLGKSNWAADAYLKATMDEVSIWTKALTADEINTNRNSFLTGNESGLYLYYRFNQGLASGTNTGLSTVQDITPNLKNGTVTNFSLTGASSNWVSSGVPTLTQNNALSFDGTNDFVAIPALASGLSQFTIETWFNASSLSPTLGFNGIINTNTWNAGDVHFQINNSKVELAVLGSTITDVNYSFSTNTWYHLAATYNASTKKINVYVNGTLVQNVSLTTAVNANFTAAQIGAWSTSRYFAGTFDEYRIWNTERTATDISSNMYKSFNGTESGLLAYFNFNEGNAAGTNTSITTLNNGIGTNHGTLNNFALSGTTSNWVRCNTGEPTNHVTNFKVEAMIDSLRLTWNDAVAPDLPNGYYIYASTTNSFIDPINGIEPTIDNDLSDGIGVVSVAQGIQTYTKWINMVGNATYYFKIYPHRIFLGLQKTYKTIPSAPQVEVLNLTQFTEQTKIVDGITSLAGASHSCVNWGDYDKDGDLDILLEGANNSKIYKNNGDNTFTEQTGIALSFYSGKAADWKDYDNDGDLDIVRIGWSGIQIAQNNYPTNSFTEKTISFAGSGENSADWGDYDKDGDLDILVTGGGSTNVYQNNGNGNFTEQTQLGLTGISQGSVAWGDYDNDGDLDIVLTGFPAGGAPITKIYRNNYPINSFTHQSSIFITGFGYSSLAWGDYDNDGDLDVLLAGDVAIQPPCQPTSKLYRNNYPLNTFTEQTQIPLTGVYMGSVSWGDYDNDGDLDILLAGDDFYNPISKIYKNNYPLNTFTEQTRISLGGASNSSVAWGDYDNDGDLDLIASGYISKSPYTATSKVYRNNSIATNTAPIAPIGLVTKIDGNIMSVLWNRVSGDETPTKGLTYNLKIGSSSGGNQLVASMSFDNGKRLISKPGNTGKDTSYTISNIWPGKYYWSVQTIDNGFKGGSFSNEETLTIDSIQASKLSASRTNNSISIHWNRGNGVRSAVFCKQGIDINGPLPLHNNAYVGDDYFGNGSQIEYSGWYCVYNGRGDSLKISGLTPYTDYTIAVVELIGTQKNERYYRMLSKTNLITIGTGLFTETDITLPGVRYGDAAWGDYNNDGFLDFILSGYATGLSISKLYTNSGNNTFVETLAFPGFCQSSLAWGDYDNDGDLDLLMSGSDGNNNAYSKIYRNNGKDENYTFTEQTTISLIGVYDNSVDWGDYDNDGDLDILITGHYLVNYVFYNSSKIYKNSGKDGNYTFTELTSVSIPNVSDCSSSWGDYDNDGDLDFFLTGNITTNLLYPTSVSRIYRNDGNSIFTEQPNIVDGNASLTGVFHGSSAWGDYDNDGDLDLLLTGNASTYLIPIPISKLYRNNGNNTFTEQTQIVLPGVFDSAVDWGDYNGDGKLDFLITGSGNAMIYLNNGNNTFTEAENLKTEYSYCSIANGDYDNDGDLDLLVTGTTGSVLNTKIYRNNIFVKTGEYLPNKKPITPIAITKIIPGSVNLSWKTDETDETNTTSTTYNFRFKNADSLKWVYSPAVNNNGYIQTPKPGNIGFQTSQTFFNLPFGKYCWQVQAVDQGYQGSDWSPINFFEIKNVKAFFTFDTVCARSANRLVDYSTSTKPIKSRKWVYYNYSTHHNDTISSDPFVDFIFPSQMTDSIKLIVSDIDGVKDSVTHIIRNKPRPTANFIAEPVCQGSINSFTNTSTANGSVYDTWLWEYGNTGGVTSSTNTTPLTINYGSPGRYKVSLKVTSTNLCWDTISHIAIVASIPIAILTLDYGNPSFCFGDSVSYSVPIDPNYSYHWLRNNDYISETTNAIKVKTVSGNYKVIITNNLSNTCSATSDVKTITANETPAIPVINPESGTTFCQGDSVKINAGSILGVATWYRNEGTLASTQNYFVAKETGSYTLKTTFANGCSSKPSLPVDVTVTPNPILPSVNYGETTICQGSSVNFSTVNSSVITFQWFRNNEIINGATSNLFSAYESGNYWLQVSNSNQCKVKTTPVSITVNSIPSNPTIVEANNNTLYCLGTEVELKITNYSSTYNYQWKRSGVIIDRATQSSYEGKLTAGDYRVEVGEGNCTVESNIITLTTKPAPPIPTLYGYGPNVWILSCSNINALDYRWYHNDVTISGAKTFQYIANRTAGDYYVEINEGGECYSRSNIFKVDFANGIDDLSSETVIVFPNPSDGLFNVTLGNTLPGELNVQVVDAMGRMVVQYLLVDSIGFPIDLTDFPNGLYFIKISYKNNVVVKKIVKQ